MTMADDPSDVVVVELVVKTTDAPPLDTVALLPLVVTVAVVDDPSDDVTWPVPGGSSVVFVPPVGAVEEGVALTEDDAGAEDESGPVDVATTLKV